MIQDEVFAGGEGDRWFVRNKPALEDDHRLTIDPVLKALEQLATVPKDVLEIGASNGYRLQELHNRCQCRVTAVEPSEEAIKDGRTRHPDVRFFCGTAARLPLANDMQFDCVIVNFVLHWIDRSQLLRSVAEIDRVLCDGGVLVIGDFFPLRPQRVAYHHLPDRDMWTYKQNYADVFLGTSLYELVSFSPVHHTTQTTGPDVEMQHRTCTIVLRKHLHGLYQTAELPV